MTHTSTVPGPTRRRALGRTRAWAISTGILLGLGACDEPATSSGASAPGAQSSAAKAEPETKSKPATKAEPDEGSPAPALPTPVPAPAKIPHFDKQGSVQTTVDGSGNGPYRFTADWHVKHIETWTRILADWVGKPNLRYLEVGVYEGRSLLWMADNVLTDPSGELHAVDIFAGDYAQTFDHNMEASGLGARVTKYTGPSSEILRDPKLGTFDIIYVDGSHTAADVLADAVLAWPLLKPGGLLIFDDYGWTGRRGTPLPPELLPRMAVDLFLAAYRYEVQMVDVGYQVAVRKVDNPCEPKDYCSPVGEYAYYWRDYELRDAQGQAVTLTDAERGLVEAIGRSRPIGSFELQIPPQVRATEEFQALAKRLGLDP